MESDTNPQPLFTLTPKDVEIVKNTFEGLRKLALFIDPHLDLSNDKDAEDLLTRIKQWQDENNTK